MPLVNKKKINERAVKMDDAWEQGAPKAVFMGVSQADFRAERDAIAAKEAARDNLLAQLKIADDEISDAYDKLDDTMVKVRNGVAGDKDFGTDSPLYGAMGFVRDSERKTGLTRKKKIAADK